MCGIVGYTGYDLNIVKRAHALQSHRGPDDAGFYSDNYVSLGHNRLAIIDLNPRSAQPMWDKTRRYSIVFNGEIYNYEALKKQHLGDYPFLTESDTEVILALFEKFGIEITCYLQGMFAFAIYDSVEKKVFLFRDEFGIKPLFYAQGDFGICFASEQKAVISMLRDLHSPLSINEQGLAEFRILGYTIAPTTLYNEISILEHGKHLAYSIEKPTCTIAKNSVQPVHGELTRVIKETILANTVADVPVGIFYSGGVDSSLITATLQQAGKNLKTFTLDVSGKTADAHYSELIAEHLQISPDKYIFGTKEFDESYEDLIDSIDHPAGSTSIFQTYYVAKQAVRDVKVALMGDGGDEIFYGYPRSLILQSLKKQPESKGVWLEQSFFWLPNFPGKNYLYEKLFRLCNYSVSYYLLTMSLMRNDMTYNNWKRTKAVVCKHMGKPEDLDRDFYLTNDLLFKSDLATSFCALEGRVPLAAGAIVENSTYGAAQSFTSGIPKHYLKKLLGEFLPAHLIERKKSGFGLSYHTIVNDSKHLKKDFAWAADYIEAHTTERLKSFSFYNKYNPQYVIVLVTLAKALANNDRIYHDIA